MICVEGKHSRTNVYPYWEPQLLWTDRIRNRSNNLWLSLVPLKENQIEDAVTVVPTLWQHVGESLFLITTSVQKRMTFF